MSEKSAESVLDLLHCHNVSTVDWVPELNPRNDDCGTNVNGLWKVETSNVACVFTMELTRDLVTEFYLFWVVFEKNAKKFNFL